MDWTNKLIKHSFPEIQMKPNKEGIYKKNLIKVGKNWSGLTESNVNPDHKAVAVLTGIKSGIIVIDFDDKNLYTETIEEFPELELAPRVATRNGYHLYFLWKNEYQKDLPAKIGKIDILKNGQQAIFPGTTYKTETGIEFEYKWENQGELIDLPSEFVAKFKVANHSEVMSQNLSKEDSFWTNLLNVINIRFIDEYTSWFHLLCALYSLGMKTEAIKMSKRSKKFKMSEFEKTWESCSKYNYTAASIRYYARMSDPDMYDEICYSKVTNDKKQFYTYCEVLLADYILEVCSDSLVFTKDNLYCYNDSAWVRDDSGAITQTLIETELLNLYDNVILKDLLKQLSCVGNDSNDIHKSISNVSKTRRGLKYQNFLAIYKLISNRLKAKDKKQDIFDLNPYIFAWKNICYDLKTNVFFKPQKFDYILGCNGLTYTEPSNSEIAEVNYIFDSIFPDKNIKKCYISILKSGLSAVRVEKFFVCTGEGRNGKGVLNDFFQYLLGGYYGNLALTVLTKPSVQGANSELRSIHEKRFLKATEPDSGCNEKLRMSNIKVITGENTMKVRGLYEKDFDINIKATIILECNKKPYIVTDGNEAERQRLVVVPFKMCFTDNEEDLREHPDKYRPKNDIYKTTEFKSKYASALFKYLITECRSNDIYIPPECMQLATEWVQDKDDICSWFFEAFEPKEGNLISITEIYKIYQDSSHYYNLSKQEKKQKKRKDFEEDISKKLKEFYIERGRTYKFNNDTKSIKVTANSIKGYSVRGCDEELAFDPE